MANENLKKMLPQRVPHSRYGEGFNDCLDQVLDAVEEKDLVEVVRCKDCKCLTEDGFCWEKINSVVGYKIPNPDDFCSYGQRKSDAEKPKVTCLNCKHFMFSDMYGECNKLFRIVHPSDTCKYAELKEEGR